MYIKKGTKTIPLLHGGAQEGHRRAGTLNVASIVGMGKAAELSSIMIYQENNARICQAYREALGQVSPAAIPKVYRNGDAPEERLSNILNVRFCGAEGEAILLRLDMFGIQVSSGSACSTDSIEPSHVLTRSWYCTGGCPWLNSFQPQPRDD